jgi:hypothetical protein
MKTRKAIGLLKWFLSTGLTIIILISLLAFLKLDQSRALNENSEKIELLNKSIDSLNHEMSILKTLYPD